MGRKTKVGADPRNDSLKRKAAFSHAKQEMRKEMDRVWRDFFDKNPNMEEEAIRRRVEERVRKKQKQKNPHKGL